MRKKVHNPAVSPNGKHWYKIILPVLAVVIVGWTLRELLSRPDTPAQIPVVPEPGPVEFVVEESAATIEMTGTARTAPPPVAVSLAKLTLRGVLASTERELSLAIIANDGGVERYFMLEDTIFDTAVLKEIHQYHVVILRDGQRRILRLSKDASEWDEEPSLELKRGRLLDDYRNAILTGDYEKFVGVAGYRPAYKGSDMYGFEIVSQSKKGDAFLRQAGLEAGDVVTSINGHELATDFEYLKYLANNIKTMTDMNIGVERAGTILFFTYTTGASTEQKQPPQSPDAGPEKRRAPANPVQEGLLKNN